MLRAGAIAALSLAAIVGSAYVGAHRGYVSAAAMATQPLEAKELADGDLVFRTGRDVMARLVLSQGESPRFSHVGVIVKQGESAFVIHAFPHDGSTEGGVQMESLSLFASTENAADVGFYRVKNIDEISRQKVRAYALRQIGKPFDNAFIFSEDAHFYCTELALKALAAGGIDLSKSIQHVDVPTLTEPVFPPDNLRRSSRLEAIMPNREGGSV